MLNIPKVLLHYVLKCLILCEEYIYIYIYIVLKCSQVFRKKYQIRL